MIVDILWSLFAGLFAIGSGSLIIVLIIMNNTIHISLRVYGIVMMIFVIIFGILSIIYTIKYELKLGIKR